MTWESGITARDPSEVQGFPSKCVSLGDFFQESLRLLELQGRDSDGHKHGWPFQNMGSYRSSSKLAYMFIDHVS